MTRLILISWLSILFGCAMIILSFLDLAPHLILILYLLGNAFTIAPYAIWVLVSNRITAASLDIAPSRMVTRLVVFFLLAFAITFGAISASLVVPEAPFFGVVGEAIFGLFFLAGFVSLIAAAIIVSGQIVDAQEHPKVGRGSRIFVLTICFFYVAIGMFFIASKLRKIQINESSEDGLPRQAK